MPEWLQACFELARRVSQSTQDNYQRTFDTPESVVKFLQPQMGNLKKENFRTILLNVRNQLIRTDVVSLGTLNAPIVHPREAFKPAIEASALSIILVHNHPSGDPEPSTEDIAITNRLKEVSELVGIELLDHIIISATSCTSLKERGVI
ncbi:MAG: DNA repair protein RadC [Candidatus Eisenbacteria bacterium]|nr:DNA repair protein RadC [Candidatus Eisenbacteria bacterium]